MLNMSVKLFNVFKYEFMCLKYCFNYKLRKYYILYNNIIYLNLPALLFHNQTSISHKHLSEAELTIIYNIISKSAKFIVYMILRLSVFGRYNRRHALISTIVRHRTLHPPTQLLNLRFILFISG